MMERYKETFETWNKLAQLYQEKFMGLEIYNDTYDFICSAIDKPEPKILEIGCGPGNITKYLISKRPDFDILGIDIAPNMLALAKKNNPTAQFALIDSREIGHLLTRFDGIVCGFCLPYLSQADCMKLIADCHNLLNDDGLIYLSFVEGDPDASGYQVGSSGDRIFFYFHELSAIAHQLMQHSFQEIAVRRVDYKKTDGETEIHTILTARKKNATSAQQAI